MIIKTFLQCLCCDNNVSSYTLSPPLSLSHGGTPSSFYGLTPCVCLVLIWLTGFTGIPPGGVWGTILGAWDLGGIGGVQGKHLT